VSALEGRTTYKEVLQLLGLKKTTAPNDLAEPGRDRLRA
jgi:hypothetical protein